MLKLTQSLACWGKDNFSSILKNELQSLPISQLPLDKATSQGGYVDNTPVTVTVNRFIDNDMTIEGRVGIFFTEIVINCGCGDDPMAINGYGEFYIIIDKQMATTTITLTGE